MEFLIIICRKVNAPDGLSSLVSIETSILFQWHIFCLENFFRSRNHFTLSKFNFEKSKDSADASYVSMVNPIREKPLSLHAAGHCYLLYINMEKTDPQCYIIDHSSCQF